MNETRDFQVEAKALRLANAFTSSDATRPALNNVHVTADRLEASDGHIGVTVRVAVEGPEDTSLLIPSQALGSLKAKDTDVRISLNGDARIISGQAETVFTPSPAMFPNLQIVYPTQEPVASIAFNPRLAAEVFKALAAYLKEDCQPTVTMHLYGPDKPIRIQAGSWDHVDVLLMPVQMKGGAS